MYQMTRNRFTPLNDEDIQRVAPSVFATQPQNDVSNKYAFVPTFKVLSALRDNGFEVAKATQSRAIEEGNKVFVKHMLRLRQKEHFNLSNVGDEIPEIVLINSHNRTSTYELMAGIFRLVCSNGMVVASASMQSIRVIHKGNNDIVREVISLSRSISQEMPKVFDQINHFKSIELERPHQEALAKAVASIIPSTIEIEPNRLLQQRRTSDNKKDLWTTSNIIQENIIKGGVYGTNTKGRRTHTRAINNIKHNIDINKAIWILTETLAKQINK